MIHRSSSFVIWTFVIRVSAIWVSPRVVRWGWVKAGVEVAAGLFEAAGDVAAVLAEGDGDALEGPADGFGEGEHGEASPGLLVVVGVGFADDVPEGVAGAGEEGF